MESHSPSDKRFNESKILSNIKSFLQKKKFFFFFFLKFTANKKTMKKCLEENGDKDEMG